MALLGLVSLFADLTYEGARSATGPFLATLGAGSLAVGLATGVGEFAGYALRVLSGLAADRTRRYWLFTFLGYAINLGAVPALAWVHRWEWAVVLLVAERIGKAIRAPARDVLLSQGTKVLGHGKGFGFHELLDQIGAVGGPLLVAWVLARQQESFHAAFLVLGIPAVASLLTLLLARVEAPEVGATPERGAPLTSAGSIPRRLRWILAFTACHFFGFAPWQILSFHCQMQQVFPLPVLPLLYAVAMAVDGVLALPFGWLYDRWGVFSLSLASLFALLGSLLAFSSSPLFVIGGIVFLGAAMAVQETGFKAAMAQESPQGRQGLVFGMLHGLWGVALLLGSAIFGALYSFGYGAVACYCVATELLSLALLFRAWRFGGPKPVPSVP